MTISVRFCAKHRQSPCPECDRIEAIGAVDIVLDAVRTLTGIGAVVFALVVANHGEYAKGLFWLVVGIGMRLEQFMVWWQRLSGSATGEQ